MIVARGRSVLFAVALILGLHDESWAQRSTPSALRAPHASSRLPVAPIAGLGALADTANTHPMGPYLLVGAVIGALTGALAAQSFNEDFCGPPAPGYACSSTSSAEGGLIGAGIGAAVGWLAWVITKPAPASQTQSSPVSLFNGRDLAGWRVDVPAADSDVRVRNPFIVRDGVLVSLGEPRGHLISDANFRDYRLEIEYRFSGTPGNAGVLVHASTPRALYGMFPKSIEVQMEHGNAGDFWCIVEDIRVPDMERRRGPPADWGITEGTARRIVNLTDNSEKPLGEWNTMVIEAVGRAIRVWVNGALVNDGFDATADHGRIALQAEGSEIEFRKLSLTPVTRLTSVR